MKAGVLGSGMVGQAISAPLAQKCISRFGCDSGRTGMFNIKIIK